MKWVLIGLGVIFVLEAICSWLAPPSDECSFCNGDGAGRAFELGEPCDYCGGTGKNVRD